jgi:copper chaperone CopZ
VKTKDMESVQWKVDGMSCTNCALSIHKYLEAEGVVAPKVNFMEGEVNFELPFEANKEKLIKKINKSKSTIIVTKYFILVLFNFLNVKF